VCSGELGYAGDALMHPSARKRTSANFRFTEFLEVHEAPVLTGRGYALVRSVTQCVPLRGLVASTDGTREHALAARLDRRRLPNGGAGRVLGWWDLGRTSHIGRRGGCIPVVHGSAAWAKTGMAIATIITAMTNATVRTNKMRLTTSYLLLYVR